MPRKEQPQMKIQRFISLDKIDTIERGATVYKRNDQAKVHWEVNKFTVTGANDTHLICKDTNGKPSVFPFEELDTLWMIRM